MNRKGAAVRDVVTFLDRGAQRTKSRPAVVMRIENNRALIVAGSTQGPREIPHIFIEPGRRLTANMNLSQPTYFYVTGLKLVAVEPLVVVGRCPPETFAGFRTLTMDAERGFLQTLIAQAEHDATSEALLDSTSVETSGPVRTPGS